MKLLVCGGRDYLDFKRIREEVQKINPDTLVHGNADGADKIAGIVAENLGIKCEVYPANWKKFGPAAGPIRNQQMLDDAKPDLILAFPGGKGTADMIKRAERAGIKVIKVED
jgi:hypothetical protein